MSDPGPAHEVAPISAAAFMASVQQDVIDRVLAILEHNTLLGLDWPRGLRNETAVRVKALRSKLHAPKPEPDGYAADATATRMRDLTESNRQLAAAFDKVCVDRDALADALQSERERVKFLEAAKAGDRFSMETAEKVSRDAIARAERAEALLSRSAGAVTERATVQRERTAFLDGQMVGNYGFEWEARGYSPNIERMGIAERRYPLPPPPTTPREETINEVRWWRREGQWWGFIGGPVAGVQRRPVCSYCRRLRPRQRHDPASHG